MAHPELAAEALRVYRRYAIEIVEAFGLCPWAERARKTGRVAERVLLQRDSTAATALDCVADLAADPNVDIGLLIFPRLTLDPLAFEHFTALVRDKDAERRPLGGIVFAMAAFHPGAEADLSDAERLIPFLRRTPDPTIQLVRQKRARQGPWQERPGYRLRRPGGARRARSARSARYRYGATSTQISHYANASPGPTTRPCSTPA